MKPEMRKELLKEAITLLIKICLIVFTAWSLIFYFDKKEQKDAYISGMHFVRIEGTWVNITRDSLTCRLTKISIVNQERLEKSRWNKP